MIGIETINATSGRAFAGLLETFLNERSNVKILYMTLRGIEGGKGMFAVLSYDKKELESLPEVDVKAVELAKEVAERRVQADIDRMVKAEELEAAEKKAEIAAKRKATIEVKKAKLKAQIKELE